jgi:TfoX/Sxy family transcriptional regulator of competence genes
MPYDEGLAQRIDEILGEASGLVQKKMFGGICYLAEGNMACGIYKEYLIVRVGPEKYEDALQQPNTKVFDITGKVMKGWVMVSEAGYEDDHDLQKWLDQGLAFARSLPPK